MPEQSQGIERYDFTLRFEGGPADGVVIKRIVPPTQVRWFLQLCLDSLPEESWWVYDREPVPDSGIRITRYEATGPIEPGIVTYKEVKV